MREFRAEYKAGRTKSLGQPTVLDRWKITPLPIKFQTEAQE